MVAENRFEVMGNDGHRSSGKMHQCPLRYTVWARIIADLVSPGVFVNLIRGG